MKAPGFSIIIVTWNGLHHLKAFLPSVLETDYPDFEIIIAENNSDDGSVEWLQEHHPNVKIAKLDQNYGYCGGNNRAVPYADKEILLFLNNDVRVEKDWLSKLAPVFNDPEVAAAQPKMKDHQEPERFEYAGASGGYLDKLGYPFCRGRIMEHVEADEGQYDDSIDIFWASGAALAVRKEVFADLDGFDEDFEFHMEEIDLCWRIQNRGYRVVCEPSSVVYHLGGGSLPMGSPRKVYYNFRNSLQMLWKNWSMRSLLLRFPIRLLLDVVAAYRELFSGEVADFTAIAKAHLYFFSRWPKIHAKRRQEIADRNRHRDPESMKNLNLIWQYFVNGKQTYQDLTNQD